MEQTTTRIATTYDIEQILVERTGIERDLLAGNYSTPLVDLGLDSLAILELQAAMSSQFGVEIPDDAISMSVEDIAAFVRANQGGN